MLCSGGVVSKYTSYLTYHGPPKSLQTKNSGYIGQQIVKNTLLKTGKYHMEI